VRLQPRIAIVVLERISARRHEVDNAVEILAGEMAIRRRGDDLGIERIRVERCGARHAQHMLRQHVEPTVMARLAVKFARHHRVAGGLAFQHLEAVGGTSSARDWLVEPVIGAADALHEPGGALGRADADHAIDRAPVDAEIERRSADHGAQVARVIALRPCGAAQARASRGAARSAGSRR
jgi:hypothetical protein